MGSEEERERYEELLQELRVMLPGVEVLFAFLLTSAFANRFQDLDSLGRTLFTVALGDLGAHRAASARSRRLAPVLGYRASAAGTAGYPIPDARFCDSRRQHVRRALRGRPIHLLHEHGVADGRPRGAGLVGAVVRVPQVVEATLTP